MWSKDGCRLVRTIPEVRGCEEKPSKQENSKKTKSLWFESGVKMLDWGAKSQRLVMLTTTQNLISVPIFRQVPYSTCLKNKNVIASMSTY